MPNPNPPLSNLTNMGKGRPPLGKIRVHIRIKPETKAWLEEQEMAIGESVDRLVEKETINKK